jgi:hypothetical protein
LKNETCAACGFDSNNWTVRSAVHAIRGLPGRWADATDGLTPDDARRRVREELGSFSEYGDHVREVRFSRRFLADSAVESPGLDLGAPPEPEFSPEPRAIDLSGALGALDREARALATRLDELNETEWDATANVDADLVDVHWVSRHAVHDATHHLQDLAFLRWALKGSPGIE